MKQKTLRARSLKSFVSMLVAPRILVINIFIEETDDVAAQILRNLASVESLSDQKGEYEKALFKLVA